MLEGVVNVLKPPGMSSSDVVTDIRHIFNMKRVGHTGTLDPGAAGVLPICIGRATRLFDYLVDKEKEYIGEITFGIATDTQDSYGAPEGRSDAVVTGEMLMEALPKFTGPQKQTAPLYSALSVDGKKMYKLARQGVEVERKVRDINVPELSFISKTGYNRYLVKIVCSKGTYVRTLCHDLGSALGCGGCMSSLRRTRAGSFTLSQAVTMQQVLDFAAEHDPQELLMPVDAVFSVHPPLIVTLGQAAKLKNGAQVRDWQFRPGTYRVYAEDGEFLLLGRVENGLLTTIKSFFEVNTLAT